MMHFSFSRGFLAQGWLLPGLLALPLAGRAQPTVVRAGLAPAANARAASRSTAVVVPFSQAIAPATAGTIRVFSSQYRGRRAATASVSGSTVTLTPTAAAAPAAFRPGETVQVTVPATVQSLSGAAATPYVYQFTAATTGSSGIFGGGSDLAVSNQLASVALGDVDGDGDLDALIGNFGGTTVNVRLNNGSGTFGGGSDPYVSFDPRSVVVGDVDGDGDLDLLTVNPISTGSVGVRFNNGSGTFSGGTDLTGFYEPRNAVLGDVDGDGDLDLVVTNYRASALSIRLNNGSGTFGGGSDLAVGSKPDGVVLGDVDGDGDLDIVAAHNDVIGAVSVRLNNGSGTFGGGTTLAVGSNPTSPALGDVDGDGDLDIVVADYNNGFVIIQANNGSGSFSGGVNLAVGVQPANVALGDLDGDGDLDMMVINSAGNPRVAAYFNNGGGLFSFGSSPNPGLAAQGVALGDVDGDGDLDLLTLDPILHSLTVRLNGGGVLPTRPAGRTAALSVYPNPGRGAVQVAGLAAGEAVAVSDALGRPVAAGVANASGIAHLPLPTGLAAGVYFVRSQAHCQRLAVE